MERFITSKPRHFTAFRSVAEEAAASRAASEGWDNEGGHIPAFGYIMRTPNAAVAFKVVLDHEDGSDTEQPCDTISECQAIIRHDTRYMASANQGRFAL